MVTSWSMTYEADEEQTRQSPTSDPTLTTPDKTVGNGQTGLGLRVQVLVGGKIVEHLIA